MKANEVLDVVVHFIDKVILMSRVKCCRFTLGTVIFLLTGCVAILSEPGKQAALKNAESVKSILYAQLNEWKGVRYRPGGLSKSGVDCSGLVYLTYRQYFGIELPRTTGGQSKSGRKISRKHLQPGDLVFFKTGWFDRHVGIYVEDHHFIHTSTKMGVMLSSLTDSYWKRKYWKAIRISR